MLQSGLKSCGNAWERSSCTFFTAGPFARLEQPSRPSQSFTKRRCPARVTVRGRRTLVILYVTGRLLYMNSVTSSMPQCLLGAFVTVPRRHCGGLPRVIAGFRENLQTCGFVIMHMSVSFFCFGGGVDLEWEFPHFFPQDLTPGFTSPRSDAIVFLTNGVYARRTISQPHRLT